MTGNIKTYVNDSKLYCMISDTIKYSTELSLKFISDIIKGSIVPNNAHNKYHFFYFVWNKDAYTK